MKIRTDFVTNSSSSSYIIAYKRVPDLNNDVLKHFPALEHFSELIKELVLNTEHYDTSKGVVVKNKKEWKEYLESDYCWGEATLEESIIDDDYLRDIYETGLSHLEKGFILLSKSVGYGDDKCYSIIQSLSDGDNFIVLEAD